MGKTISPSKSAIQCGVIFGIIMILELVISYSFDLTSEDKAYGITINILNFLILPITLIVIGCNNFKDKFNSGFISFAECLKIGVTICIIAALMYAIFYVIFDMIFPEFGEKIINQAKEAVIKQGEGQPKEQTKMALSMTEKMMSPFVIVPITIVMYAFIGLIYSLIIGAILKKERPNSL